MKKKLFWSCLFLLFCVNSLIVSARSENQSNANLLKAIPEKKNKCFNSSKASFARMNSSEKVQANYAYANCLRGLIVELSNEFYKAEVFDFNGIDDELDNLSNNMTGLYTKVFSGASASSSETTEMYHVISTTEYCNFLEGFLKSMAMRLSDYDQTILNDEWLLSWNGGTADLSMNWNK